METENINKKLEALLKNINEVAYQLKSLRNTAKHIDDNKKELHEALAKAQGEFKPASQSKTNQYFKSQYADLNAVVKASRPALSKYGLSVTQQIEVNDGQTFIDTVLRHESGQSISSTMHVNPPAQDIQSLASYIAYVKRIAYASLTGVTDDMDDDAQTVMTNYRKDAKKIKLNTDYNPREQEFNKVTKEQVEELRYELNDYDDITGQILESLRIQSLADMPKDKYLTAISRIKEIKYARRGLKE